MSEEFVRHVNGAWYERVYSPVRYRVSPSRRSLVNEIAFRIFLRQARDGSRSRGLLSASDVVDATFQEIITDERWARLSGAAPIDIYERREINTLRNRLRTFFPHDSAVEIKLEPKFRGCGIIDASSGDIIKGNALYEVKAAGRFFRSIDLRQLLVYSALNKQAGTYEFSDIGIFNPRIGVYYQSSLSEVCYEVSGRSADELLGDIIERASAADISR
jgi:hypothetical protein